MLFLVSYVFSVEDYFTAVTQKLARNRVKQRGFACTVRAYYGDEFALNVMPCLSQIGSGSLPVDRLPSAALTFTPHDGRGSRLEALAARWRALPVPIIGRIYDGRLWLDLRCLEDETRFMEMMLK